MPGKLSEKILLYRLQTKQDPEAFTELYDSYVKRIYRFVFFKVPGHEEAEDITSEVFLKVWNHIAENKEIKSFSGLLYRVARNCIIDLYRSKSYQPNPLLLSELPEGIEPSDKGIAVEKISVSSEAEEMIKAIKKLKQEYQEVLTLKYVDELNVDEIAEITGKGQIAVRVTLHRAMKKLKIMVEK
ncbi:MAG: sigma-70 family RNA polymerase sigma factor [Candidatus Magasanikbacteria bacterium]|nr:sigma-70 family RNA polymerase sigma factor [Candidatus Magasanikbacteria bacterium]